MRLKDLLRATRNTRSTTEILIKLYNNKGNELMMDKFIATASAREVRDLKHLLNNLQITKFELVDNVYHITLDTPIGMVIS